MAGPLSPISCVDLESRTVTEVKRRSSSWHIRPCDLRLEYSNERAIVGKQDDEGLQRSSECTPSLDSFSQAQKAPRVKIELRRSSTERSPERMRELLGRVALRPRKILCQIRGNARSGLTIASTLSKRQCGECRGLQDGRPEAKVENEITDRSRSDTYTKH